MINYIQTGDTITATAPYDVVGGAGAKVGGMFGVCGVSGLSGTIAEFATEGVFDLAKDASTFAEGALVYWDDAAKKCTSTVATNLKIGVHVPVQPDGTSAPGALTGDATIRVRLNGAF